MCTAQGYTHILLNIVAIFNLNAKSKYDFRQENEPKSNQCFSGKSEDGKQQALFEVEVQQMP